MLTAIASSTAESLLKVVASSVVASAVVSVVFSITVLGAIRASELRRANRGGSAAAYTTLAICGLLAFLGVIAYGLLLLTQKS